MTYSRIFVLAIALGASATLGARSAAAQVPVPTLAPAMATAAAPDPCPPPVKQPPANSPVLINCVSLVAHPVNETLVDRLTYAYYLKMPLTLPSQDKWAPYDEKVIQADFWNLWRTNFLENLWVEVLDEPFANGVAARHVIFHLEERPRVKAVDYVAAASDQKLQVELSKIDSTLKEKGIEVRLDSFVDAATIRRVIGVIRDLYAEKGYNDAAIDTEMQAVAGTQKLIDLRFVIAQGPRVRIKDVAFDGNNAFSDGKLRGQMKENKSPSMVTVMTDTGIFREDKFAEDAERLMEFYKNHGYAGAQVGSPQTEVISTDRDGKTRWIRVRVPVDEGPQFRIGKFEIGGEPTIRADYLRSMFKIKEGDIFSLQKIRKGFEKAKEAYGAFGFWQWQPQPELVPRGIDMTTGAPLGGEPIMDVTIRMDEGKRFFVNRIRFVGNTTTHDAVIRRELRVVEGAVFNAEALKESVRRLNQLGYFKPLEGKEGEMDVVPTANTDDQLDIKLKVEEQNRNQISFGAGVSQFEGFFGQLSFQTANFLGRGETVGVSLQKGSQARQYQLSFSEPYLFDRPINVGVDIHSRQFIYPLSFTQESTGGSIVTGMPLADFTRGYLSYSYESIRVVDINPSYLTPQALINNPFLGDSLLVSQNGRRKVSKISPSAVFNTVNQPLFPTAGQRYTASLDVAGLGGNTDYVSGQLEGIWYHPLSVRTSFGLRAQVQYIRPYGRTSTLPIFEKLFLGGEYSVRGFDARTVAPRDSLTGVIVGGNKSMTFNAEYYFNIMSQLRVVAFYDAGQVKDIGQKFSWHEPVTQVVGPDLPPLIDFLGNPNALTPPGAIHVDITGRTSAFKTSTGAEVRFFMPVLNVPFRLIAAFNPQRNGVPKNDLTPTPRYTFRFAVGTTF